MKEVRKIYLDEDDIIEVIAKAYDVNSTKIELYQSTTLDYSCGNIVATFELEEDDE